MPLREFIDTPARYAQHLRSAPLCHAQRTQEVPIQKPPGMERLSGGHPGGGRDGKGVHERRGLYFLNVRVPEIMVLTMLWRPMMSSRMAA